MKKTKWLRNLTLLLLIGCLFSFYLVAHYIDKLAPRNLAPNHHPQHAHNQKRAKEIDIPPPPMLPASHNLFAKNEITVMGWNVENLFDTFDDPATKDDDYTPRGRYRWRDSVLRQKLYNLTDIIRRIDAGNGPDIIGLCEIENRYVLEQLARHPNIAKLRYDFRYLRDAQDPRGIDVAVLSRYPAKVSWHQVYFGGRDILHARFSIHGRRLHLFVNHWRSRLGGKARSKGRRIQAAKKCRALIAAIIAEDAQADIIILGDFNDTPDDVSIRRYLRAVPYRGKSERAWLYNLTRTAQVPRWLRPGALDQIIISRGLLDKYGFSYVPNSFQIVAFPFMCTENGYALGYSAATASGYSDHFPVIARFQQQ